MREAKHCSVDGCEKPAKTNHLCSMHYARVWRHGNPHTRFPSHRPRTGEEIMRLYVPDQPNGQCWVWQGHLDRRGYGVVQHNGRPARAHRVIYEHLVGPIPEGKILMHSCDNPPCVNPAHLTPGTDAENLRDMAARGRSARGSKHRAAKLTERQVVEIRARFAAGGCTQKQLAQEYGLTETPISQLLHGITWRHVPMPQEMNS